ncbi:MAG: GlsB/YeaQ/YmgE family stress response membrane protein [Acidimicrobiia bacterium]|nr:GlsB/YeaQ/YmgE family stress response membrane protein [Acidimicrobiia bacterium]
MGIIAWLVFGGLAGWVASMVMDTNKEQGIFLNIIVGIIGAAIGGFLMHVLGGEKTFEFNLSSFAVAVLGAIVLLFLVKLVSGRKV